MCSDASASPSGEMSFREFVSEVRSKLLDARSEAGMPRELQLASFTSIFKNSWSITDLPKMLKAVINDAFSSHADIRQLLTIYADRLSWHVLPGEENMHERDKERLIIQTRDTERALADQLTALQYHLRSSDLEATDHVREGNLLINGCYVHLWLLHLMHTLGDQASTIALERYSQNYEAFVKEYRARREQKCSMTITESKTEVIAQDFGRTLVVQLPSRAPQHVSEDTVIQIYFDAIIGKHSFPVSYGTIAMARR